MKVQSPFHILLVGCSLVFTTGLVGQEPPASPQKWRLAVDGEFLEWVVDPRWTEDSLESAIPSLLSYLRRQGRLEARFDSIRKEEDGSVIFQVTGGPPYRVEAIDVDGFGSLDIPSRSLRTRAGEVFDPEPFEQDINALLLHMERLGYVTAEVRVTRFETRVVDGQGLIRLGLQIDPGEQPTLAEIRLPGGGRTRISYVARLAGLEPGKPLRAFDAREIRSRLVETGDFQRIGNPNLIVEPNGAAVLVIPLEESAPGAFDAVLGYLPASGGSRRGSVVGNVDVSLRHLMGAGRRFRFQFNRMPARVSRLAIEGEDPFVAGSPFRFAAGFEGYQKDSTYARQRFRVETGYRLGGSVEAFLSASREATRPGTDSLVAVPRSNTWFGGIGFRVSRLDNPRSPTRGWVLSLSAERGAKVRSQGSGPGSAPGPARGEGLRQQRLFAVWRHYVPVVGRHIAVWGGETSVVLSPAYDESDLFQLGGANSLRGYNEEQFEGNFTGRAMGEWRVRLDDDSHVFLFTDLGLLGRPGSGSGSGAEDELQGSDWQLYPGYGMGMQFGTEAGHFTVSLALNPSEGLGTKVHVGISLGL